MNIHTLFPSKFVKAGDLNGRNVTVEIDRLAIEKIGVPGKLEEKPILYFRRATKGMVLNRTNALTIAALYSPETDNWTGQRVTLYPTRVQAFGGMHEVIRILAEIPPKPKAGTQPEDIQFMAEDIPDDDLNDPTATVVSTQSTLSAAEGLNTSVSTALNTSVEPEPVAAKPHRKLGLATENHLKEYNALLGALYGKDADQWRHHYTSQAGKSTSKDLTQAEAAQIIAGLQAQLVNKIVLAVDDDDLNTILLTHNQPSLADASPVALTHIWKDIFATLNASVQAQSQPHEQAA